MKGLDLATLHLMVSTLLKTLQEFHHLMLHLLPITTPQPTAPTLLNSLVPHPWDTSLGLEVFLLSKVAGSQCLLILLLAKLLPLWTREQ